jgi:hypothetical protein
VKVLYCRVGMDSPSSPSKKAKKSKKDKGERKHKKEKRHSKGEDITNSPTATANAPDDEASPSEDVPPASPQLEQSSPEPTQPEESSSEAKDTDCRQGELYQFDDSKDEWVLKCDKALIKITAAVQSPEVFIWVAAAATAPTKPLVKQRISVDAGLQSGIILFIELSNNYL